MRITTNIQTPAFKPFTLNIEVGTKEDLAVLFYISGLNLRIPENVPAEVSSPSRAFVDNLRKVLEPLFLAPRPVGDGFGPFPKW